jgi:hypothetical protein
MTNLISKLFKSKENEFPKIPLKTRIHDYERLESSLKDFFSATNFCYENCFSQEKTKISFKKRKKDADILPIWEKYTKEKAEGKYGCCHSNMNEEFYVFSKRDEKTFDEMNFEYLQLYNTKLDFSQTGSCRKHTDAGCAIEKFRSPVCNSFICSPHANNLLQKYNIGYRSEALQFTFQSLVDDLGTSSKEIDYKISQINKAIKRIKNHKEGMWQVNYDERITI